VPSWQHPRSCLELCHDLSGTEPCLRNAFTALIFARISSDSKTERLIHKRIYGRALSDLQVALRDHERLFSDETLIACMLLTAYETLEGSSLDHVEWTSHAQGAARLIELRGPERHQNGQAHRAFLASRISTIYASIIQRQSTYLAAQEWRSIPWTDEPRTYLDQLLDIATSIPGLLERIDKNLDANAADDNELLKDFFSTKKSLDDWRQQLRKENEPQAFKHKGSSKDDYYPFKSALWFDNYVHAFDMFLFHTYSLVITEAIQCLNNSPGADDQQSFDSASHAKSIAKMVPYCLQPEMGALGFCIINIPLLQARQYFHRVSNATVVEWIDKIFRNKGNRAWCDCAIQCASPCAEQDGCMKEHSPSLNRETSNEDSEDGANTNQRKCSTVMVRFVQENPSRYYVELSSEDPTENGLPLRTKDMYQDPED
jgi:hypothetical protein